MSGWTCRPCSNGAHLHCNGEVNGVYCSCIEGECREAA